MNSIQEQVKEICKLSEQVISNPLQTPITTAKTLNLSPDVISFVSTGLIVPGPFVYAPIIGALLYVWRKYTESQKRKEEKERMLREVIVKQQAVIRKLEAEEEKMRRENAQNRVEVENLKKMLDLLEQTQDLINNAQ